MLHKKQYKILISGMSFNVGGVETYIMSFFRNIDKHLFQVDFINDQKRDDIAFQDEITLAGSKIYHLHGKKEWVRFFKEKNGEYDAIIFNIIAPYFHQIRVCCKYGGFKAVVVHSHNGSVDLPSFLKPIIPISMKYERLKLSHLPIVRWACSDKAAEWMFGKNKDYTFIKNGINAEKFKYSESIRSEVRKELGLSVFDYCIGHIGRFDPQKNHDYLVKIFIEYSKVDNNAKLVLAGPLLNESIVNKVKEEIKNNNLEDRVLMLGLRNDSYRLYQAMDVFVLPSLYEGLPIVGVEAQCAGLPCLFSNQISSQVKVLDSSKFFSITDDSINSWIDALKNLKNVKIDRNNGYQAIVDNGFVMEREIKKIEENLVQNIEKGM